jgi:hypothetical protein
MNRNDAKKKSQIGFTYDGEPICFIIVDIKKKAL